MLDVCRRREQPTNLLRAENNRQAARLAGRHDLVGKIAALERDFEEKAQCAGIGVDSRYRGSDRRQSQLVSSHILSSGLIRRAANEVRKAFDVADIVVLSLGTKPADRHIIDQPLA
jgi:hypothetical protein